MSDYIPEDNLWLILICLPVKSLLQYRCVCKGWKDIIDSPVFVQEHLSLQNPNFIFQDESSSEIYALHHALPYLSLLNQDDLVADPIFDPRHFIFLATHNGAVCLCDSSSSPMFDLPSHEFFILWNPSIRKHLTVKIPHFLDRDWCYGAVESCFGFWIDPFTKEFKFIIIDLVLEEENEDADPIGMKGIVYSSVRRDWREIPGVELGSLQSYPTVMIKGVAHWRGTRSADNADYILSFDFIHERFDTIEMPVLDGTNEFIHCHWQGNLSVVVKDHRYPACDNYLLYMRHQGSWVKMFDFNLLPSLKSIFWVLGEAERARVLVEDDHDQRVFYDTADGKLTYPDENLEEYDPRLDHISLYDTTDGKLTYPDENLEEYDPRLDHISLYDTTDGKLTYPDENLEEYDPRLNHISLYDIANLDYDFVESLLFP